MQFLHALAVFKKLIATGVFSSSSILLHQEKETETAKGDEEGKDPGKISLSAGENVRG